MPITCDWVKSDKYDREYEAIIGKYTLIARENGSWRIFVGSDGPHDQIKSGTTTRLNGLDPAKTAALEALEEIIEHEERKA